MIFLQKGSVSLVFCGLLLFSYFTISMSVCMHGKKKVPVRQTDVTTEDQVLGDGASRTLASYSGIRIHLDYSNMHNVDTKLSDHIQHVLAPAASSYFNKALRVNFPVAGPLTIAYKVSECDTGLPIPEYLRPGNSGVSADLVLLVTAVYDDDEYLAYAFACASDQHGRPILGNINFNLKYLTTESKDMASQIGTTLHEVIHVLGFSDELYDSFIDPKTKKRLGIDNVIANVDRGGVEVSTVILEGVVSRARNYFNCPTLDGLDIENEGGDASAGCHWERKLLFNEMMTASDMVDTRFSEFTLALLEGTGWYKVDYSMTDPFTWGKNKGCSFIRGTCVVADEPAFPEFCGPIQSEGCYWGGDYKGICSAKKGKPKSAYNYYGNKTKIEDGFANNCPYYQPYIEDGSCQNPINIYDNPFFPENYGKGTKCFQATLSDDSKYQNAQSAVQSGCFSYNCTESDGGATTLTITVGSQNVTCGVGATHVAVPGYNGFLYCPDPTEFCSFSEKFCSYGCLGRGTCNTGTSKCKCKVGWTGDNCAERERVQNCVKCQGLDKADCYGDVCVFGEILGTGMVALAVLIISLII